MDDESLLVPEDGDDDLEVDELRKQAEDIRKVFLKLGITQLVFGVLLIAGGILIACTWPNWGADRAGEAIWCGVFIVMCGAMAVTARFYLNAGVVIASLIINILVAVLLTAGIIIAAVSTFSNIRYETGEIAKFIPLNCGLTVCIVLSIYLAIVFGKILSLKKDTNYCCFGAFPPTGYPGYTMVYVPPGAQTSNPATGVYIAAPGNMAAQPQTTTA